MRDLENFEVLTLAKELAGFCYRLTSQLPDTERFGLTSQMNRASVSVAANIAEGLGRGTPGDLERHLRIALGSAAELQILTEIAEQNHSLPSETVIDFGARMTTLRKKLNRLTTQVAQDRRVPRPSSPAGDA